MKTQLVLLAVCISVGNVASLCSDSLNQELFVYQQNIHAIHELLKAECSECVSIREEDRALPVRLEVAKIVYGILIESLGKCRGQDSDTSTPTQPTPVPPTTIPSTPTPPNPTPPSPIPPTAIPTHRKDCQDHYDHGKRKDGVYEIEVPNSNLGPFDVWCDFFDGHGWTAIQKRFDGSVDFFRRWVEYKNGFGNVSGEHWLGNDKIHALTQTNQRLYIYLEVPNGNSNSGVWKEFHIKDESDKYRFSVSSDGYVGDLEKNSLKSNLGMQFTTRDRDNDAHEYEDCAALMQGGWWYEQCGDVNLNGLYEGKREQGVYWKGFSDSTVTSTMSLNRD